MASSSKQKTTMAKRDRENRLRERREIKKAKKDARKLAAQSPDLPAYEVPGELLPAEGEAPEPEGDAPPAGEAPGPEGAVLPAAGEPAAPES